ncbi:hypothetical protein Sjap_002471 [Stephania japonica]|uniref:Uncharacterized protein n=1 Tax=Stephania japonica TaxID=461633 RepID=A0AAP0PW54_9MAGN
MPKRRIAAPPRSCLLRGAGRLKGSCEKDSTFMKSWVSLSLLFSIKGGGDGSSCCVGGCGCGGGATLEGSIVGDVKVQEERN